MICLCITSLVSAALAQLTPGVVVSSGDPFPIVADVNHDGFDDLIQEHNVIINTNGMMLDFVHDLGLPSTQKVIGALDVNGDGIVDLLTSEGGPGAGAMVYRLYIGNMMGTYSQPIVVSNGSRPFIADVDGDGRDDFVLFNDVSPDGFRTIYTEVTVLRSLGDGTFEHLDPVRIPPGFQISPDYRVLTGDLGHDGRPDLVVRCANDLVILRGLGGGHFAVESHFLPRDYGYWSTRLTDVDGDGNLDVVMAGQRNIRVLFGDGHGNFPRMTSTPIAKLHDASAPNGWTSDKLDATRQPRDIAIGHFTHSDRNEIAAGTSEGDLVIFAYEDGALQEVARTRTDFLSLDIRAGKFNGRGGDDVYVQGVVSLAGAPYPTPRLYDGPDALAVSPSVRLPVRRRPSGPPARSHIGLQVHITAECLDIAERWEFVRDGIFATAQQGQTTVEAVFDGPYIYYRLSAPWLNPQDIAITATLTETNGAYSGTALVGTSCGLKTMTITATTTE